MAKTNSMGSEVVEGFECKPKRLDPDKPIMFSAVQIFLCEGKRCQRDVQCDLAKKLRNIIKELGYDQGENRVKVTRTHCNGACRFGQFAFSYKNSNAPCFSEDNAFTAWKKVNTWSESQWKELIVSLVNNEDAPSIKKYMVEQQVFDSKSKE